MDPSWTSSDAAPKDARPFYPEPPDLGRMPPGRAGLTRTMVVAAALVGVTAIALAVAMIGGPPAKDAAARATPPTAVTQQASTAVAPAALSDLPPTGAGPVAEGATPAAEPSAQPVPYPAWGTGTTSPTSPGSPSSSTASTSSAAPTPPAPSARHALPVATRAAAPEREVCLSCGTVVSVHAVTVAAPTTGVGAVGGGAVGAVVGSQVAGHGDRTLGAILGAIGGGLVGHQVEKQARHTTAYDVRVRMEDGSYRTLRQSVPWKVGAKVNVSGQKLRALNGTT